MRKISLVFILIGFTLILSTPLYASPLPTVVFDPGPHAEWKPTPEQVEYLDDLLKVEINNWRLKAKSEMFKPKQFSEYGRQYFGIKKSDSIFIKVFGFCSMMGLKKEDLEKQPMYVMDGGVCFFEALYNVKLKKLDHFDFHGEA